MLLYDRRRLVRAAAAALAVAAIPARARAARTPAFEKTLSLYNLHTRERTTARFWIDGADDFTGLAEIDYVLRDFRTGEVRPIDRRILHLLHALRRDLDSGAAYEVISGYRSPKTNAELRANGRSVARRSYHMAGMAIDVRLPGRDTVALRDAARRRRAGGVGHYPRYDFVHLDTGPVRHW